MIGSTYAACLAAVEKAAGRKLTEDESDDVFSRAQGRMRRLQREGLSATEAAAEAGRQLGTEARAAAAIEQRNTALNMQKRVVLRERIAARAIELGDKSANLGDALHTEISALNTPTGQGGERFSTEAVWKNRVKEYLGGIESELRQAGLIGGFRSGALEQQWGRELYELSMRDAGRPHQVGVTGSAEAQKIAGIISRYQALARDRLNREGGAIGDYAGYITRTAHDPDAIYKAGRDTWANDMYDWLDHDRTFEDAPDPAKFLDGTWRSLVTGVHLSDKGGVGMGDPGFSGPGNLARKISESRVLHFKDAESWLAYQQKYGLGTLHEQTLGAFARAARQEALLQRWGTNPRAEFDNTVRWLQEQFSGKDELAVRNFGKQVGLSRDLFGYLDGTNNLVKNQMAANLGAGLRAIASLSKLGGVMFTHLSSAATGAAELRYHGVGLLDAYSNDLKTFLHGFEGAEARELHDRIQSGAEGMHGSMLAPMTMDDSLPGTLSKISNRFFQLTGLTYVVKGKKDGAGAIMARHFGDLVDKAFDELPAASQRGLRLYDISPSDWDALRTAPNHFQIDGRTFLTPDAADRAAGTMSARDRDMLALKLRTYYGDVADRYVITPNIADQRYARLGSIAAPGTLAGEAMRFIAQFKTWPTAAVRQGLGREINGGQGVAGAITGIVHLAIMGSAFGYLRMVLSDLSKGITPRDPHSRDTWLAAMAQGGGAGILGDFLFGEANRFGGGLSDTALGPVFGQAATTIMQIWNNLKAEKGNHRVDPKDHIPSELLRLGLDNTPFINLFYTRSALNYLFLYSIQEALNPGFLRRSEQNLKRQTGQTHILSPVTHHLRTFGA